MNPKQYPSPTVSVIIPAYNVAPYIAETIQSVLTQSYTDYEIIVVNDGSTDKTEEAILEFREHLIYVSQPNSGPSCARNNAIKLARGKYLALLDGDDIWVPDYLEKMVGRLEAEPEIDLIFANAELFGDPYFEGQYFFDKSPVSEPVTFEKVLTRECNVCIASVFKRELINRIGGFDPQLRGVEDFDLWLRMLKAGARFAYTLEPLLRYRKRSSSLSSEEIRLAQADIRVYEKVLEDPATTPLQQKLAQEMIEQREAKISLATAKQLIANRDFQNATWYLQKASSHYKGWKMKASVLALRTAPSLFAWALNLREYVDKKLNS
ncbi:MAG TPA: glycosyltransferase [Blastocatellia bacterium]|nr:glycosyltransferase [Blastocatellia bacterium]